MLWVRNASRTEASAFSPSPFTRPTTVCISITNPGSEPCQLDTPGYRRILRVSYDDTEHIRYVPGGRVFNEEDALQLAAFIKENWGSNFLVHCEAGVSRSGAVVEAILAYAALPCNCTLEDAEEHYASHEYVDAGGVRYPNGHILSLLKRALGIVPIGFKLEDKRGKE